MTELHLNYDSKNKNGIIFNDTYQGCMYRGEEFKPVLSFQYQEFGYSEIFDLRAFVVGIDGVKRIMEDNQILEIQTVARNWVQPLGQEGNPTVEQAQGFKKNEILTAFNSSVEAIVKVEPHEMSSWRKQEEQARAWDVDNTYATPIIDSILATRNLGETKQELVTKIISNATIYEVLYGNLLGKYQNRLKQIASTTTVDEANIITW